VSLVETSTALAGDVGKNAVPTTVIAAMEIDTAAKRLDKTAVPSLCWSDRSLSSSLLVRMCHTLTVVAVAGKERDENEGLATGRRCRDESLDGTKAAVAVSDATRIVATVDRDGCFMVS